MIHQADCSAIWPGQADESGSVLLDLRGMRWSHLNNPGTLLSVEADRQGNFMRKYASIALLFGLGCRCCLEELANFHRKGKYDRRGFLIGNNIQRTEVTQLHRFWPLPQNMSSLQ